MRNEILQLRTDHSKSLIAFMIVAVILLHSFAQAMLAQKEERVGEPYMAGHSINDLEKTIAKAQYYSSNVATPSDGSIAAPAHDNFANAQQVSGTGGIATTNVSATAEPGEPIHGAGRGAVLTSQNNSVWFKYIPQQNGVLTVFTQSPNQGDIGDLVLSAYTGSAVNSLTVLGECDDYPGMDLHARVTFGVTAGQTYLIAADGYQGTTGSFMFGYQFTAAALNDNFAGSTNLGSGSTSPFIGVTGSNAGATVEANEPVHVRPGGAINSIWYSWTPNQSHSMTFETLGSQMDTMLAVYTGDTVSTLTEVAANDDIFFGVGGPSRVTFFATAGVTYRIAIDGYSDAIGNSLLNWYQNRGESGKRFDFNGDRRTDISIFRPSNGQWWISQSGSGVIATTFGTGSDKLVPADYTGDGKVDIAAWRPSTGYWYVLRSEDSSFYSFPFGTAGDVPVGAQYTKADAHADYMVFRPSTGTWYIRQTHPSTFATVQFGSPGDVPVVADYDGDGLSDLSIYRPSNGQWWLKRSTAGVIATTFGVSGDKPVIGDYTGDGRADVAFWRPSTSEWFVLRSEDSSYYSFPFGISTDTPAPGDYNGDGRFEAAVFRSSTATWYLQTPGGGASVVAFGSPGDRPIANSYVP